jgi:hypothetical protein
MSAAWRRVSQSLKEPIRRAMVGGMVGGVGDVLASREKPRCKPSEM